MRSASGTRGFPASFKTLSLNCSHDNSFDWSPVFLSSAGLYFLPVSAALPADAKTDSICTCPNPLQKMPA